MRLALAFQLAVSPLVALPPNSMLDVTDCSSTKHSHFADCPMQSSTTFQRLWLSALLRLVLSDAVPGQRHGMTSRILPTSLTLKSVPMRLLAAWISILQRPSAWTCSRSSCRTTWASRNRRTCVAGRSRKTGRVHVSRISSISNGTPVKAELADKLLIPILGEQYGEALERQELQVGYDRGTFVGPLL